MSTFLIVPGCNRDAHQGCTIGSLRLLRRQDTGGFRRTKREFGDRIDAQVLSYYDAPEPFWKGVDACEETTSGPVCSAIMPRGPESREFCRAARAERLGGLGARQN